MTRAEIWLKAGRELLFWLASLLICGLILYPIYHKIEYKLYATNLLFLLVALTYFRWFIQFRDLMLIKNKWSALILFLFNFQLFVLVIAKFSMVLNLIDAVSVIDFAHAFKSKLSMSQDVALLKYIVTELVFSGVSSLILILLLNLKIMLSFWKRRMKRLTD